MSPGIDNESIRDEVGQAQQSGKARVETVRSYLGDVTRDARGASEESADRVKEWK